MSHLYTFNYKTQHLQAEMIFVWDCIDRKWYGMLMEELGGVVLPYVTDDYGELILVSVDRGARVLQSANN